jgi:hypothetical protein
MRPLPLPALLVCAALAFASDKVKLEAKHAKGEVFVEKSTLRARLSAKLDDGAGHVGEFVLVSNERKEIRDEVLEVAEGRPTKVKRTFAVWDREDTRRIAGQPVPNAPDQKGPKPIAGKSVTLVLDGERPKAEEAPPEAKDLDEGDLRLASKFELLLPAGEVEEGATWSLDDAALKRFFAGRVVESARVACVFEGLVDFKGGRAAKLMTEVEVAYPAEPGKQVRRTMKMRGPVFWDPAAGRFLQASFSGEATAELPGLATIVGPIETEISLDRPE